MASVLDWLFPPIRRRVLALLLGRPEKRWHLRELSREAGFAVGTVRREVNGLAGTGLLLRQKEGNRVYYQANRDSPVFQELSGLLRKTAALADVLRDALVPLGEHIGAAFVYGSFASGTPGLLSDVDLMVIGEATFSEVVSALAPAQMTLSREVNPTVYPPKEFVSRVASGDHFVTSVLAGPKLFLIGSEHDLEQLAGQRLAD